MKSKELVVGERYRLRYRLFTPTGNTNYGYPLQDGFGTLESKYTVGGYNHTFILDDGQEVWATPNSVFKIEDSSMISKNVISDIANLLNADDAIDVTIFLSGLDIASSIVDDHLVIPPKSISKFKQLVHSLYYDILIG